MRGSRILGAVLICLFAINSLTGQDIHFTQFYTNPVFVNPANTGNFNGDYRVGANARTQWGSVTQPYQTLGVHGDFALLEDGIGDNNWIGLGANMLLDRAGDGLLTTVKAHGSIAFHKHISDNAYFSLGGAFGYVQKSIDYSLLTFGSQWNGSSFNTELPQMEDFERNSFGYLDVSSGLTFTYFVENSTRITVGGGVHHVNEPTESFYFTDNNTGNNRLGFRPVVHADAEFSLDLVSIMPAAYFTYTKKVSELVLGTNVAYHMDGSSVIGGLWFRDTGSLAGLIGFQFDTNRIMLSYDLDVGDAKDFSNSRNGLELSIMRVGGIRERGSRMYCPRF